jgi:hypothetical protein
MPKNDLLFNTANTGSAHRLPFRVRWQVQLRQNFADHIFVPKSPLVGQELEPLGLELNITRPRGCSSPRRKKYWLITCK